MARRPHRGALRHAGGDAPETCAETIHLIAGGESGPPSRRARDAAGHPRPAGHGLVAGRAAIRHAGDASTCSRRPTGWWSTARPGVATVSTASATWPRCAETTGIAVSDFAMVRQSRWREAIASIFDDPDYLPYLRSLRRISVTYGDPRRYRRARLDQPRQARLPRRVARVPARDARRQAARAGRDGPAEAGEDRGRHRRGRACIAGWRPRCPTGAPRSPSSSGRSRSDMPSGTTLRVELLWSGAARSCGRM